MQRRFATGQAAARAGVHIPSERGMTMKPGNAVGPRTGGTKDKTAAQIRAEKILASLGYAPEHVKKFQYHWNLVVATNMLAGAPLAEDGILGPETRSALETAFAYANSMPKDWMHYVHKAIQIGPQTKPKPTASGDIAAPRATKSRRRRRRR
jgi:hypothetical protein